MAIQTDLRHIVDTLRIWAEIHKSMIIRGTRFLKSMPAPPTLRRSPRAFPILSRFSGSTRRSPKFAAFGKATARSFRLICSRSEDCPAHLISFAGGAGPGDDGLDLNHQLAERNRGPALLGSSQGHSRLYPLSLVDFGHAPERTRSFALSRNHLPSGPWNTRSGRFLHLFGYGQRLRRPYL